MLNFEFYNPARILFGKGMEEQVGKRMAALGRRVLLVYGGGSIKRSGLYDTVLACLADAGVEVTELAGVQPNPRLGLVREGSVSAVKTGSTPFWRSEAAASSTPPKQSRSARVPTGTCGTFFERLVPVEKALPVGVVLTIPAAGSESSDSCVITKEEGLLKRSCAGEALIPLFRHPQPGFYLHPASLSDSLRRYRHPRPPHGAVFHPGRSRGSHRPAAGGHHAHGYQLHPFGSRTPRRLSYPGGADVGGYRRPQQPAGHRPDRGLGFPPDRA